MRRTIAVITLSLVTTASSFMFSQAAPQANATVADSVLTSATDDEYSAMAGLCTGSVDEPELLVTYENGVPDKRYALGVAYQSCGSNDPYVQEICVKFQVYTGSSYQDFTTWRCNTNTGPNISVSITKLCGQVGNNTLIRTGSRGRVTPVNFPTQTRYAYSAGTRPC